MIQTSGSTEQSPNRATPSLNLAGEWIGYYRGHFDQVIKITQEGETLEATKITGDEHVPAGQVTFRVNLQTMSGEGQVAEREFRNPCFVPGTLTVLSHERIIFHWDKCGSVEFRKDD